MSGDGHTFIPPSLDSGPTCLWPAAHGRQRRESVAVMATVDTTSEESTDFCALCLEEKPMAPSTFKCVHAFCDGCTTAYLKSGGRSCPCCRAECRVYTPSRPARTRHVLVVASRRRPGGQGGVTRTVYILPVRRAINLESQQVGSETLSPAPQATGGQRLSMADAAAELGVPLAVVLHVLRASQRRNAAREGVVRD